MSKLTLVIIIIFGLLGIVANHSLFVVDEREQALVLQFGQFKQEHTTPGLKFKLPFVQNVVYYTKKSIMVNPQPQEVILADQKRLVVDSFAYYKISDPLKFYKNLTSEVRAGGSLGDRINSNLREVLGKYSLQDVLSKQRSSIMEQIQTNMNNEIGSLGVKLVDVRIGRADLPEQTSRSIYARMITERQREAREFRARGDETARRIKSNADKEKQIIISKAKKESEIIRGKADAEAIDTYAQAFSQDESFYKFYRTMQAYKNALAQENTNIILSPESNSFLDALSLQ